MTGSSGVVIGNLAYLVGAVVLAVVIGFAVWFRHRPPRSVESNVESFHRGLRALAPDERIVRPIGTTARPGPTGLRIQSTHPDDAAAGPGAAGEVVEAEPLQDAEPAEGAEPVAADEAVVAGEVSDGDDAVEEPEPGATAPVVNLTEQAHPQPAAGEAAGDWAGVETG